MTSVLDEQLLRIGLASEIERGSAVLSSRVVEAFLNVPRHPFVPVFYREEGGLYRAWCATDLADSAWLRQVYTDRVLVTEVDGMHAEDAGLDGRKGAATSSSTLPSLMADMLDALDVRPGDRVLEIGTGTGYNAALLCHLVGAAHVTTVDRTEQLVTTARARLSEVGFEPTVVRADGVAGCPGGAPYDRIIATCSVRRIPQAWLDQCGPGGLIVAPIGGALGGGALARLTKLPDGRAVGRFLHRPAGFMPLRSGDAPGPPAREPRAGGRITEVGARVLDDYGFSFWAGLHLAPTIVRHGRTLHDPADGSAARVQDHPDGSSTVAVSGPRDLWQTIETAYRTWLDRNRPRREWFTVETGPDGQSVGYTGPDGSSSRWKL
ncbi:methyltransferase domain-containing protein [Kitasatospora sp. NBC_01300]|uniref:methyltransferase domain-containing protein n=1 Tax=Kitasatospora sp. NBC_01300 TaxID=2903574 RepID=UPI00352DCB90|nr:methyltransferase domain-containing protein [Kitasatospora sp. NBC_01300]